MSRILHTLQVGSYKESPVARDRDLGVTCEEVVGGALRLGEMTGGEVVRNKPRVEY